MKSIILFIARCFLSFIFILSSFQKVFNWRDVENYLINTFVEWHSFVSWDSLRDFFTFILPWTPLILVISTILELFGGLLILFAIKPKFGAWILVLFLIPTTILIHSFWFFEGSRKEVELSMFMKNIAIIGGLLMVSIHGVKRKMQIPSFKKPSISING